MQKATHDITRATSMARQALPIYAAAYPGDMRLQLALDGHTHPDAIQVLVQSAADVAEKFNGDRVQATRLMRAANAAECVWLALHELPDIADIEEALHYTLLS